MQNPFTIAVVGKGSSRSSWNASQPSFTNPSASCGDLKRVNSSTSAPAMKLSLPERTMRPFGFSTRIAASARPSSSSASRESVLADSPSLSKVSQASPSRSVSQRQCRVNVEAVEARSIKGVPVYLLSKRFHEHRAAEAAADADAGDAALRVVALQRLKEVQDDARARGAHRMAERNRSPIHIELFLIQRTKCTIEPQFLAAVFLVAPGCKAADDLRGKGLVDLPVVEVVQAEAVALQDRRGRVDRSESHLRRIEPCPLRVGDAPDRLEAVFLQRLLGGEQHPG